MCTPTIIPTAKRIPSPSNRSPQNRFLPCPAKRAAPGGARLKGVADLRCLRASYSAELVRSYGKMKAFFELWFDYKLLKKVIRVGAQAYPLL